MNSLTEQFKWARFAITICGALALTGLPSSVQSGEKCGVVEERGIAGMPGVPAAPGYQIVASPDGYIIQMSPRVIARLPLGPKGSQVEVTLVDPVQGRSVVSGPAAKISGNSFKITTAKKLRYKATAGKTWILIRMGKLGGIGEGGASCSGCPHASDMTQCKDPGICMCPCFDDPVPPSDKPVFQQR